MFVSSEATQILHSARDRANAKFVCYQCLASMPRNKARAHVGGHILKAIRGIHEDLKGTPVSLMAATSKSSGLEVLNINT